MKKISARIFNCRRCQAQVVVCSRCDRGQIYCSNLCSQAARAATCRAASQRYQNSRQGKLNHAVQQRNYMKRQGDGKNKMTYQGSHDDKDSVLLSYDKVEMDKLHCHFCKRPVEICLRSGFLGSLTEDWSSRSIRRTKAA